MKKPCGFERVEVRGYASCPSVSCGLLVAEVSPDVLLQDMDVEVCVVGKEGGVAHVVEEASQCLPWRHLYVVAQRLDEWVFDVSEAWGNGLVGVEKDGEGRVLYHFPLVQFHGGNLYDVIFEDVQPGGLGVEDDDVALFDVACEFLDICGIGILDEVGGQQGYVFAIAAFMASVIIL